MVERDLVGDKRGAVVCSELQGSCVRVSKHVLMLSQAELVWGVVRGLTLWSPNPPGQDRTTSGLARREMGRKTLSENMAVTGHILPTRRSEQEKG